jgi:magnesium-transporting ATPase (P-type)
VSNTKEDDLDAHGERIEFGYSLVGASAIEDKLQDGVSETISVLMSADIRVWILTGDKQETAIEIGRSCSLIKPNMDLVDLSSDSLSTFENTLYELGKEYDIVNKDMAEL